MHQWIIPTLAPIKDYSRLKLGRKHIVYIYYCILVTIIFVAMNQLESYYDCNVWNCTLSKRNQLRIIPEFNVIVWSRIYLLYFIN
jgi:hypothetical protein